MTTPTRTTQQILAFIAEIREREFEDANDLPANSYASGWCSGAMATCNEIETWLRGEDEE